MKRKMEVSELIFAIISYTLLTVFALCCLYPFVYAISSAISEYTYVDRSLITLLPMGKLQADAFKEMFLSNVFWCSYTNTLFLTLFGTVWSLFSSILGAYALSKKRLLFRKGLNFFLVFTMWFSAGVVPQYENYKSTQEVLASVGEAINISGLGDPRWLIVIAMGMAAMNIILLRNAFEGVPSEIEEAARVDGATETQILTKVYIPMSKSTIATVTLFFAISRWNGYFWANKMTGHEYEKPLQVFIHDRLEELTGDNSLDTTMGWNLIHNYAPYSLIYALIVCAIVPILIIYPFIQKYFAKGVNMGGVKE